MLLMIDNYDSFTYNLYQYFCELGQEVVVVRNDKITLDEIEKMNTRAHRDLSGSFDSSAGGISNDVIKQFRPEVAAYWEYAWATSASDTAYGGSFGTSS